MPPRRRRTRSRRKKTGPKRKIISRKRTPRRSGYKRRRTPRKRRMPGGLLRTGRKQKGGAPEWTQRLTTALRGIFTECDLEIVPMPSVAGQDTHGPYIAEGGFGTVWKARDLKNGVEVAVKVCDGTDPEAAEVARHEISALKAMQGFRKVIQFRADHTKEILVDGQMKTAVLIVTDLFQGEELMEIMIKRSGGMLEAIAKVHIRLILEAIAGMHQRGWAHRDLTPMNIMCDLARSTLVIIDLGATHQQEQVASLNDVVAAARQGMLQGTGELEKGLKDGDIKMVRIDGDSASVATVRWTEGKWAPHNQVEDDEGLRRAEYEAKVRYVREVLPDDPPPQHPCYLAPEADPLDKDRLSEPYDAFAVDMFSLGVCAYIMLYRALPFEGDVKSRKSNMRTKENLEFKQDIDVTQGAKDFISGLLRRGGELGERLTAVQALEDKWIKDGWDEFPTDLASSLHIHTHKVVAADKGEPEIELSQHDKPEEGVPPPEAAAGAELRAADEKAGHDLKDLKELVRREEAHRAGLPAFFEGERLQHLREDGAGNTTVLLNDNWQSKKNAGGRSVRVPARAEVEITAINPPPAPGKQKGQYSFSLDDYVKVQVVDNSDKVGFIRKIHLKLPVVKTCRACGTVLREKLDIDEGVCLSCQEDAARGG